MTDKEQLEIKVERNGWIIRKMQMVGRLFWLTNTSLPVVHLSYTHNEVNMSSVQWWVVIPKSAFQTGQLPSYQGQAASFQECFSGGQECLITLVKNCYIDIKHSHILTYIGYVNLSFVQCALILIWNWGYPVLALRCRTQSSEPWIFLYMFPQNCLSICS